MRRIFQVSLLLAAASAMYGQAPAQGKGKQPAGSAGTESGWGAFQTRCMGRHGNAAVPNAQTPEQIPQMTAEGNHAAPTTGSMQAQGEPLGEEQGPIPATCIGARP